jgi:hypothetical protein
MDAIATSNLPPAVASAFRRSMSVFNHSDNFIDRVYQLSSLVDHVNAWRWAEVIDPAQSELLLVEIRRAAQSDLGSITRDYPSAAELDACDQRHRQWAAELANC